MRRKDTWTGEHHWIPENGEWAKDHPRLWEALYSNYTSYLEHDDHVQVQNDTKKYGSIGAQSIWELRKLSRWLGM